MLWRAVGALGSRSVAAAVKVFHGDADPHAETLKAFTGLTPEPAIVLLPVGDSDNEWDNRDALKAAEVAKTPYNAFAKVSRSVHLPLFFPEPLTAGEAATLTVRERLDSLPLLTASAAATAALFLGRWPETLPVWLIAGAWAVGKLPVAAEERRIGQEVETKVERAEFCRCNTAMDARVGRARRHDPRRIDPIGIVTAQATKGALVQIPPTYRAEPQRPGRAGRRILVRR